MIVPMRHVTLLCVSSERERTLDALRALGVLHLNLTSPETDSNRLRTAQANLAAIRQVQSLLREALADKPVTPAVAAAHLTSEQKQIVADLFEQTIPDTITGDIATRIRTVQALAAARQTYVDAIARLEHEIACYLPFGEFDTALPGRLAAQGVPVHLFRCPANAAFINPQGVVIKTLGTDKNFIYGVMIGPGEIPSACENLEPPELSITTLQAWLGQATTRAAHITDLLKHTAAHHAEAFDGEAARLTEESAFVAALDAMQAHGAVAWIAGWAPAECERTLRDTAAAHAWGLLSRAPSDSEFPPTLIRPPRLFRPMQALFTGLGIAPAYQEADVSVVFFAFFSIFFAMLVGDGSYGVLILLLTLWARKKLPRVPQAPFILMTAFGVATLIWGALSNTWFGFHPAALANPVSAWFNQPNGKGDSNLMLLCFTLGVVHLSIARLWNAIELFPDTKALAQIGWIGVVWFMYFVAGSVVGVLQMPMIMKPVFAVSLFLIAFFMLKKSELKTHGADLGMLPLNIISCLGDIISYVRLFAVGLASVKVAENFNDMAIGLDLPMIVKIPCMLLILLLGHALNFAMAGLAVLVHAVRLNTLEFSNHKGISWSGFAFKPFKRL